MNIIEEGHRRKSYPLPGSLSPEKPPSTPLEALYRKLIAQIPEPQSICLQDDCVYPSVARAHSPEAANAAEVVNYAYNSRYVDDGGRIINIARDRLDPLPSTHTLIAAQPFGGESVVLGTFRIVCGNQLDLFELFELTNGRPWPHLDNSGTQTLRPGELGRFSFHPILDHLRRSQPELKPQVEKFRREILRGLWTYGMGLMRKEGVQLPYFVLAAHVKDFVESAGIHPQPVESVKPAHNKTAVQIQQRFSKYWCPDSPVDQQPKVYIAPWEVSPLK